MRYEVCKKCGIKRNTEDMPDCIMCDVVAIAQVKREAAIKSHLRRKEKDA